MQKIHYETLVKKIVWFSQSLEKHSRIGCSTQDAIQSEACKCLMTLLSHNVEIRETSIRSKSFLVTAVSPFCYVCFSFRI